MNRYVAFLRGMNLGERRIRNKELGAEFEALGLADVSCFRASGNVVFDSEQSDEPTLIAKIEAGLGEALGYAVPIFLREAAELREIASREPFDSSAADDSKGKLQVAFLPEEPNGSAAKNALALATDEDRLAIEGRELYWLPSGGISESNLDLRALETALGPWTMRTMGTVEQLVAKHFEV